MFGYHLSECACRWDFYMTAHKIKLPATYNDVNNSKKLINQGKSELLFFLPKTNTNYN